ncbi:MAG: phage holin family protein [Planctomycetaceae bacterium]|nr:phage holin family protein [Planctomycetaceae bacterium]
MRFIDRLRFVWLPCALFILGTEVVCATSGWGDVKRNVGNDCYISIRNDTCYVSTNPHGIRIRVWYHPQRPEYDFNSRLLFFRFHPIIMEADSEPEYLQDSLAGKIDFDYLIVSGNSHVSLTEWTYFIVDKMSKNVSGPFTKVEFLNHPELATVTEWNWKSPEKTQFERGVDGLTLTVALLFVIILMNIWWLGPLFVLTVIAVVLYRRIKKKSPLNRKTTNEIRDV